METSEAIRTKRAIREFDRRALPRDVVLRILRAGRRSQSSKNTQPWNFLVVQDPALREALSKLGTYAGHLAGAPMVILLASPDPASRPSILFDLGQVAAYLQLGAWDLGIASCLATIYEPAKAAELLHLPSDQHVRFAISFGYPADPQAMVSPPHRPGRRPLEEIVHWDGWESSKAGAP